MLTLSRLRSTRKPDVVIGDDYLRRWWLIPRNRWFNIYLHEINRSDDDRALHDHPWWNCSIVLKGGYDEVTETGIHRLLRGHIRLRSGTARHRLVIPSGEQAITLFVTGPKYRHWGFWCPKGFMPWERFTNPENYGQVGAGCDG